jgi:hypothetical protein
MNGLVIAILSGPKGWFRTSYEMERSGRCCPTTHSITRKRLLNGLVRDYY